jgi:hypothetical protein
MQRGVAVSPKQHASGELAVSAGSPCLLIVGLRSWRWRPVDDQSNVRLVDTHAEGAGGHDHVDAISQEVIECEAPPDLAQAGVIGDGAVACLRQSTGDSFGGRPRGSIHDGDNIVASEQREQCAHPFGFALHVHRAEPEIGAVEGAEVEGVPSA